MTNLLIGYPDIPQKAGVVGCNKTFDTNNSLYNLISGERYQIGKLVDSTSTLTRISLDLGNQTRASNFIAIARADLLQSALCDSITLKGHSANSVGAATTVYTNGSFDTATLYGPRSTDFYTTFASSSSYRYWWIEYTVTGDSYLEHSKFYTGSYFDFGKDPEDIKISKIEAKQGKEYSSSGALHLAKNEQTKYRIEITYTGITDTTFRSFMTNVVNQTYRKKGVFLFTSTDHTILDNQRILHCELLGVDSEGIQTNWNNVSCTFEELIG